MKAIDIKNLDFSYGSHPVLNNLNFSVDAGKVAVITGENGSGKSTLIKIMIGENEPTKGTVKIFDSPIDKKTLNKIGYVPQTQGENFITFPLTSKELVVLQAYDDFGPIKLPTRDLYKKAEKKLVELGLKDYINCPVTELSGGLRQRVMIARAMMNEPEILIFDEPTAGVDEDSKNYLAELLKKLNRDFKVTVILVTHELEWIRDKIKEYSNYRLLKGEIVNA
ncbi:metal ABC transporter ATP-binding protein [Lagierella sp.]|uniref:metal ABC transporter ATP-binding protein n=1 Tax=Lagierella sp. TaxID=2849657 RepID=UPI002610D64E|nr:metal ABC transporter ATP-binding protein [Lagierella sp.]